MNHPSACMCDECAVTVAYSSDNYYKAERSNLQDQVFELRHDLQWALRTAKSRKFTRRDYTEDDRKIIELLNKYKLDAR